MKMSGSAHGNTLSRRPSTFSSLLPRVTTQISYTQRTPAEPDAPSMTDVSAFTTAGIIGIIVGMFVLCICCTCVCVAIGKFRDKRRNRQEGQEDSPEEALSEVAGPRYVDPAPDYESVVASSHTNTPYSSGVNLDVVQLPGPPDYQKVMSQPTLYKVRTPGQSPSSSVHNLAVNQVGAPPTYELSQSLHDLSKRLVRSVRLASRSAEDLTSHRPPMNRVSMRRGIMERRNRAEGVRGNANGNNGRDGASQNGTREDMLPQSEVVITVNGMDGEMVDADEERDDDDDVFGDRECDVWLRR